MYERARAANTHAHAHTHARTACRLFPAKQQDTQDLRALSLSLSLALTVEFSVPRSPGFSRSLRDGLCSRECFSRPFASSCLCFFLRCIFAETASLECSNNKGLVFVLLKHPYKQKTVTASGASGKARASGKACDWVRREKLREKKLRWVVLFYFILFFSYAHSHPLYVRACVCVCCPCKGVLVEVQRSIKSRLTHSSTHHGATAIAQWH